MNEIQKLLAEKDAIRSKLAGTDEMTTEDLDAAEARIKEIDAKVEELRKADEDARAKRAKLTADLEAQYQRGELRTIATMPSNGLDVRGSIHETTDLGVGGEIYKRAWLKDLARRSNVSLGESIDMTDAEKRAFSATTGNTTTVIPTMIQTKIWDLVNASQAFYGDLNIDTMKMTGKR